MARHGTCNSNRMLNFLGDNPAETIAQVISAMATAVAAIFAAVSARSASQSAKEMERARELSSAPLLTITPINTPAGYYLDLSNGYGSTGPGKELHIENHGNGPATNISVHFEIELARGFPEEEILVADSERNFIFSKDGKREEFKSTSSCSVNQSGILWVPDEFKSNTSVSIAGTYHIVSLARGEGDHLSIPSTMIRRWFIDAVAHNKYSGKLNHVSHLSVSITYDTMLRRAQRQVFRFQINSDEFPPLATRVVPGTGGLSYEFRLEPVASLSVAGG